MIRRLAPTTLFPVLHLIYGQVDGMTLFDVGQGKASFSVGWGNVTRPGPSVRYFPTLYDTPHSFQLTSPCTI